MLHLLHGHTSEEEAQCSVDAAPRLDAGAAGGMGSSQVAFPVHPISAWPAEGGQSTASVARPQTGWHLPSGESPKAESHSNQRGLGDHRLLSTGWRHYTALIFLELVLCHLSCASGFNTLPNVTAAPKLITANVFNQRHMFSAVKIHQL